MNHNPKMLKVETGRMEETFKYFPTDEFIDYRVYDHVPKWWRLIEQFLRLDIHLALQAKKIADQYDIIWANSEKVGIPLSFMKLEKPLVVILQYPESPLRFLLLKLTGIARRWAGVGIVAKKERDFLQSELGVNDRRIFQYFAARTDLFQSVDVQPHEKSPILSMGVAKRDYDTLIAALAGLPGYQTDIYVSSKYGDKYQGRGVRGKVDWIRFPGRVPDKELCWTYQQAKFVVVPLLATSHSGAGVTSVFEASASGKAVIATNTGGMDSYVLHGKTGLLVPPGDVPAMRNAIKTLWENPDLAHQMGMAGRKFVEENYSHDMVVAEISAFLRTLWLDSNKR